MNKVNYGIFLVYPILLAVLFVGSKIAKKKEWNEEALSLKQMKYWQGFVALVIMFHHISQKWSASWIDKKYYVPGLEFFVPIGYVLVSFFVFSSGYGLYKSVHTKKDYLKKSFIVRRIVPLIAMGYAIHILFLLVRIFVLHEKMGGHKWFNYLSGFQLGNPNGWYVIVMPFFYLFFYLAFRFVKRDDVVPGFYNEKVALVVVTLCTLAYQIFCASLDHNEFCNLVFHDNMDNNGWFRGEWWYNSIELFPIGIFFAMHEEKIVAHLKKYYKIYVVLVVLLIGPVFFISQAQFGHTYYCDSNPYWDNGMTRADRTVERFICLCCEAALAIISVFAAVLGNLKIKIGNRFLELMGKITLEFYLIHGLFVELFCYQFGGQLEPLVYIKNNVLHTVIVFALGLPLALLVHKIAHPGKKKESANAPEAAEKAENQ